MDALNFLNDPQRRYKVIWLSDLEAHLRVGKGFHEVLMHLNQRLEACEPGTTIAKIYYDPMRLAHAIIVHNLAWPTLPDGEMPQTYIPPIKSTPLQIGDDSIIDIEVIPDDPKESNGCKAT